tara:strand:- start:1840 stop:2520 length:681 start_codon:yes stop_codon:yes gene_type:complete
MSKQAILIFARSNSKRLPGKVLKEIYLGKNLLEIIILRLKKFLRIKIIVCTSKSKADNKIVKICKKNKIKYFRGELSNVFKRTKDCLKKYKLKSFIRINADRPFVDFDEIQKIIRIYKKKKFDIITNNLNRNCPKGLTCELAQSKIFFDLDEKNLSKVEKEHIFDYFYENKQGYKIFSIKNNLYKKNRNKNFSIDNLSDLKRVRKIYKLLNNIYFPTKKILLFRDE